MTEKIVSYQETADHAEIRRAEPDRGMVLRFEPTRTERDPRGAARRRRAFEFALALGTPILFLASWQTVAVTEALNPQFFPGLDRVWRTGVELVESGELLTNVLASLRRILLGFALGTSVGALLGFTMAMSRHVRAALDPLLTALYTVPKLALLPLFILVLGVGEAPKIFTIAATVFFFIWMTTMSAFMQIPYGYRETGRAFRADRLQMFRHILLPAALPQIFSALRLTIGLSVLVVVGVEFVQSNDGIGWLIWTSWSLFMAERMYVGIVTVSLMGVALTYVVRLIGRLLMPWSREDNGGISSL